MSSLESWAAFILTGLCILLVVLPPKWDPAIRLKEWLESKKERR
jgi:hypothetical protein